uniref:Protein FAM184A/B N-terminal domain-containing protein n=1 Tax=Hemiselmis andersenii TaxID=464988 RepID=A0A6T8KJC2_HEMAN|mmetsp:Transcript_3638/g.8363  ORF Transcript_3638/g.8363 Transcript_3638/m.8363 type:complete len:831 (-) Transcript_3638:204-2696(-)
MESAVGYFNGGDERGPEEEQAVLEESHYKMCKKIAQLTRVIGMLVNKNEEQEYEKQYLSEAFEAELGKVVDEANSIINEMRMDAGGAEGSKIDATDMLRAIGKQHEAEKKNSYNEFADFKMRVKERERALIQQFERRIEEMVKEQGDLKDQFEHNTRAFAETMQLMHNEKAETVEQIKLTHDQQITELINKSTRRLNDTLAEKARAEEELRNQLRGEFEQALEQTQKSAEDRVRHIRQEEEIKNRANMESIRRELGGEIDRYRLAEASLRHTVSELQQRCADYELTLARREKELHDLEQRKAEEADMEYQKSRQMIDRLEREISRMDDAHKRELEETSLRLLEQSNERVREIEIKYIAQLNEATRNAEERLEKQEKLIKTQMNDLFLKLQQDFAEQTKAAAQLMQDKEDEWRARETDLKDQIDANERRSNAEKEELEKEFNAKLKETLVNLRATEAEGQRIAVERDQIRMQNESLSSTLHETKRSFIREQETRSHEFDERDKARQVHIQELEKNLKVLYSADERARELEHYHKVLQNRLQDLEATHEEEKAKVMERHTKELFKLKGEIERQKQLAEQQEGALIEKHQAEAEAYEAEQKELNNALIHKYETLISRKEQEQETQRQNDLRQLVDEHKRQTEQAKTSWQKEREEALREAKSDASVRIEELMMQINTVQAQLKSKEAESEQRRGETVSMAQNVERLKVEFLKQMQAEELRMQEEIQAMQSKHSAEHQEYQVRAEQVLKAAQEQFERANDAMIQRIKELEFKLVTRESRPEDLERISQLEKDVAEKEYLCKRIMEEMKYFKMELENRDTMDAAEKEKKANRSKKR